MVKISVIIPAYNAEQYIKQSIECCLKQTYRDFEVIVVNDGSVDTTKQIVESYIEEYNDKIVLINQTNQGLVRARVSGINSAKGEFVFFIDADDTMPCDSLERLYSLSEGNDIVIGDFHLMDSNHNKFPRQHRNDPIYGTDRLSMMCNYLTKSVTASLCGRLIRRKLLLNRFVPEDITIGEDFIYNLLMLSCADISVRVVNVHAYNYIQYPISMVNTKNEKTLNQRLKYIKWVVDYIKQSNLYKDKNLYECLSYFIFNEYYSYLRDGGKPSDNLPFYEDYLLRNWNKRALSSLPKWQKLMIKSFKKSEKLGLIYKTLFVNVRNCIS